MKKDLICSDCKNKIIIKYNDDNTIEMFCENCKTQYDFAKKIIIIKKSITQRSKDTWPTMWSKMKQRATIIARHLKLGERIGGKIGTLINDEEWDMIVKECEKL